MNPKILQSNDDLASYLVWLGNRLGDGGQAALADDVILASRFANGSPSEFLHEAQTALEKVVHLRPSSLANEEIEGAKAVVVQIKVAFKKIGGA
jgi:hypothetical protein